MYSQKRGLKSQQLLLASTYASGLSWQKLYGVTTTAGGEEGPTKLGRALTLYQRRLSSGTELLTTCLLCAVHAASPPRQRPFSPVRPLLLLCAHSLPVVLVVHFEPQTPVQNARKITRKHHLPHHLVQSSSRCKLKLSGRSSAIPGLHEADWPALLCLCCHTCRQAIWPAPIRICESEKHASSEQALDVVRGLQAPLHAFRHNGYSK